MRDQEILASVIQRFREIACSPQTEERYPVGPESAKALGYAASDIDLLPASVTESFAGVGNPFALGEIQDGQTVFDLGCGAGLDSILAARKVGPGGRVIGIDLTKEMVEKAKRNAAAVGVSNVEFRQGNIDAIPVENGSVDLAITNGVLNLCLNKPKVLAEVFRTLRPGTDRPIRANFDRLDGATLGFGVSSLWLYVRRRSRHAVLKAWSDWSGAGMWGAVIPCGAAGRVPVCRDSRLLNWS